MGSGSTQGVCNRMVGFRWHNALVEKGVGYFEIVDIGCLGGWHTALRRDTLGVFKVDDCLYTGEILGRV